MQSKRGTEGSIRKALRCKESGALKARSEKRYGAKKDGHWRLDQKSVTVQRNMVHGLWVKNHVRVRPSGFIIVVAFLTQHHYISTSLHRDITT